MINKIIKKVWRYFVYIALFLWILVFVNSYNESNALWTDLPTIEEFQSDLYKSETQINISGVSENKTLKDNIFMLFYPSTGNGGNVIFNIVKDMTLWVMIIFLVRCGASLLFGEKKSENLTKTLLNMLYILIWWMFIYWASWIFWDVLWFGQAWVICPGEVEATSGIEWFVCVVKNTLFQKILLTLKAFSFFLAIIMIVVTWFRVVAAGDWEKWKKLVKGIINIVVALLVIKWIDVVYYISASSDFVSQMSDLIINVAKVFAYLYWIAIVIMIIVAWYLYLTDWWSWNWFKKASNIFVNILLSWLVLFAFLFIIYQVFAEFGDGWSAVAMIMQHLNYV